MKKTTAAAVFAGSVAAAAAAGAQFNPNPGTRTGDWYARLEKSPLNPPNAVFGPVWTTLYALIAIAGWRIWRNRAAGPDRNRALQLWTAQLGVNALWSPIFFGAKQPGVAMLDLLALLGLQGAFLNKARRVDRMATWLFVPYVAWCLFASHLNFEVVRRNSF